MKLLTCIRVEDSRPPGSKDWGCRSAAASIAKRAKLLGLEAQGRGLLVNHSLPAPAHWWKNQTWSRLKKLLPEWIIPHLELYRPILLAGEPRTGAAAV